MAEKTDGANPVVAEGNEERAEVRGAKTRVWRGLRYSRVAELLKENPNSYRRASRIAYRAGWNEPPCLPFSTYLFFFPPCSLNWVDGRLVPVLDFQSDIGRPIETPRIAECLMLKRSDGVFTPYTPTDADSASCDWTVVEIKAASQGAAAVLDAEA